MNCSIIGVAEARLSGDVSSAVFKVSERERSKDFPVVFCCAD
jgi:hypothetical protein